MPRQLWIALVSIALLAAACLPAAPAAPVATSAELPGAPRSGGTLRYGLTLPVSGIDPHIHASSELGIPLRSVYDTLVIQDAAGFHPSLAVNWAVSDDGLTYRFELRHDVKFHDGTDFNAAAVVRSLQRIVDPATRSQKAVFMLGPFDEAQALDDDTVQITLKQPYAPLLDSLSQVYLGIASPAALDKWGDEYQLHQVGTGPFRFVSYAERQELVLERNPDYAWAPAQRQHAGPAYLERIEFRFFPDAATRLAGLLSGQVDVMGEMAPTDVALIRKAADPRMAALRVVPAAVPGQTVQLLLNTTLPPLDQLQVRQALLYATDRQTLAASIFGPDSPAAAGPLSAVTRGFDPSLRDRYPFDPAKAASLLAEAGWLPGSDGIRRREGQPLTIRGALMSWGELPQVGTILQAQWRASGIDLQLETLAYPAALEAGRNGSHHFVPFSSSSSDPDILATFFHSRNIGGFNWSRANDPEVDVWLDQAAAATAWETRGSLYAQIQQRVMDQAWILPVRDQVNLNAASSRVQGLQYDIQGWFPILYDVWLEAE